MPLAALPLHPNTNPRGTAGARDGDAIASNYYY